MEEERELTLREMKVRDNPDKEIIWMKILGVKMSEVMKAGEINRKKFYAIGKHFQDMGEGTIIKIGVGVDYAFDQIVSQFLRIKKITEIFEEEYDDAYDIIYFKDNDLYTGVDHEDYMTTTRYRIVKEETKEEFLTLIEGKKTLDEETILKYTKAIEKFRVD